MIAAAHFLAYDFDGYELFAGDYVASGKKLYKIIAIWLENNEAVLELMHVKTTKIVKKKDFEVERLS
jgi:hypothetical protein